MKDFKNYIISDDSTLIVACEAITKNKSRCVLIESKNKIIGIVSEGDIIRAFLMEQILILELKIIQI